MYINIYIPLHTQTHTQPVAQIVKLGTVKLGTSAPAVSAVGVDTSAEALKDRNERFVTHGSTVSLKNTGGPPRPGPKTQLGTYICTYVCVCVCVCVCVGR